MPKIILEERVRFRIEREMNRSLKSIECDGALEPEVGASAGCSLSDEDVTREVTVTVDNVEGGLVGLAINN